MSTEIIDVIICSGKIFIIPGYTPENIIRLLTNGTTGGLAHEAESIFLKAALYVVFESLMIGFVFGQSTKKVSMSFSRV